MIVELSGGAEMYFGAQRLEVPDNEIISRQIHNVGGLICYLYDKYDRSRNTLFKNDHTLSPGILCCVDDVDWQLLGNEQAEITPLSNILFLSTMHGG